MDTSELILAAHVREIAIEMRRTAAVVAGRAEGPEGRQPGETADAHVVRFSKDHPLTEYAPEALKRLTDFARAMRS